MELLQQPRRRNMKGILFKPDMIQAIVEGRKTVTRRLSGLKEINKEPDRWVNILPKSSASAFVLLDKKRFGIWVKPRYQVGETVYIKEAWCESYYGKPICYKLDGKESPGPKGFWRSPMLLKAEDARYFIKITDVRAERLQEINKVRHDEVLKEGYPFIYNILELNEHPETTFARYWNSINKDYHWESNPWVWVYTFHKDRGLTKA
jgi:hypothetical protein